MDDSSEYTNHSASGKLTWSELKDQVNELRKRLSPLSRMVPSGITFRQMPDGRTRIYFLSCKQGRRENTVLCADISNNSTSNDKLHWHTKIEPDFLATYKLSSTYSREEEMLWERKRLTAWGITSYELHQESGKLVFAAASSIYQFIDTEYSTGPIFPYELRVPHCGAKLDPEICPVNSDLISYIYKGDIWVMHSISGYNVRLTYAHKGGRTLAEDPLSAGVPSYIMQEEFKRFEGYWWSPVCTDGVYRIIYEEVDDSKVKVFAFSTSNGEIEEYRYPRAGTNNSKSTIKMIQFTLNQWMNIDSLKMLELQYPLLTILDRTEYLVRAGWLPNGKYIWVQLLNRAQTRLDLAIISIECFTDPLPNVYETPDTASAQTPNVVNQQIVQVLYVEESSFWINVTNLLYFMPMENDSNEVRFVVSSEETGFRHLYYVTSHLSAVNDTIDLNYWFLKPKFCQKVALTSGEWQVLDEGLWVDEQRELVYFIGLRDTPLEKHLYVVSFRRPGDIRKLTTSGYSYSISFNKDKTIFSAVYSSLTQLPACQIFRIGHNDWTVDGIQLTPIGYLLESTLPDLDYPGEDLPSDIFTPDIYSHHISTGHKLYAMVFKPHNFQAGKKYPTVVSIYGGPEVQLVTNTFKGMRQLRMHMLASQGCCVVAIDNRGSCNRGVEFESYISCRMGSVELQDQVEMLKWLAYEKLDYIDMNRIGLHGWSYGGYLSLMGLVQYPDIFKVAIAGAPVTSWYLYDTGYTERYMNEPKNNLDGYSMSSVLDKDNLFPNEPNRLLIIHGLIDENVHFFHTSQLINALIKVGKPYQLQIYPNERHSLRHIETSVHYETALLEFVQNNL